MFLGLQGEYICTVSEDREEIENIKEIAGITEIRETDEPVERIDGEFIVGNENIKNKISDMRKEYRHKHIDDNTAERSRKMANGSWMPADEAAYLALDAEVTSYIEEHLPYPTDPITKPRED